MKLLIENKIAQRLLCMVA